MSEIKLNSVIKNFGGNSLAVDNLSVIFPSGEFVCLLGPSGCGKTTTLRMIAGLERPDSGEIYCGDQTFFSSNTGEYLKTEKRNLGLMFQSYALWPHMTVFQNIVFGLDMKNKTSLEKEKRFEELEKLFQLKNLKNRYPSELSGGQQQRVALGRALVTRPKIILFDEPLSNLDAILRGTVRNEIKRIQSEFKLTAIYVTHDQSEALSISDRVILMKEGEINQIDTPEKIYDNPISYFSASFVGISNIHHFKNSKKLENDFIEVDTNVGKLKMLYKNNLTDKNIYVSWRPENAEVGEQRENTLFGRIKSIAFQGAFTELEVEIKNIKIKIITQKRGFKINEEIKFGIKPENLLVLEKS